MVTRYHQYKQEHQQHYPHITPTILHNYLRPYNKCIYIDNICIETHKYVTLTISTNNDRGDSNKA